MRNLIHIIITGGTIDSLWDGKQDTIAVGEHSIIPLYVQGLKLYDEIKFSEVCMKDSRALNQEDLKNIQNAIEDSEATKFVISHGTYTMPDTARFLKANLKRKDATVILTGSMTPLKGFDFSDAGFNLGFAFSKAQDLESGVYLCMNGRVFTAEEAAKSLSEGKFYSIFSDKQ
jgi:L-asparaginase